MFLNPHAMLLLCNSRHSSRKLKNSNCTYQMLFIKIITIHFPYISSFFIISVSVSISYNAFLRFQCTELLIYTICGDVKIRIKRNYSVNWRFSYIVLPILKHLLSMNPNWKLFFSLFLLCCRQGIKKYVLNREKKEC